MSRSAKYSQALPARAAGGKLRKPPVCSMQPQIGCPDAGFVPTLACSAAPAAPAVRGDHRNVCAEQEFPAAQVESAEPLPSRRRRRLRRGFRRHRGRRARPGFLQPQRRPQLPLGAAGGPGDCALIGLLSKSLLGKRLLAFYPKGVAAFRACATPHGRPHVMPIARLSSRYRTALQLKCCIDFPPSSLS